MDVKELRSALPAISDVRLLEAMLQHGKNREIAAGETFMKPGQSIKMVPLVLQGAIKVIRSHENGQDLFLYYLNKGDTCALSLTCCSKHQPSEVKAIAEEDTQLLCIPIDIHEKWMDEFRQWKEFVAGTYHHRFQEMLSALDAVAFHRMDERLLQYLEKKVKQLKSFELKITHQEIANELGTSREVITRLLKQLEKKGWVETGRNVIYVRDDFENLSD